MPDDQIAPKGQMPPKDVRTRSTRGILRKSVPFLVALLIGGLLGVMVAGFAVFAAHS